LENIFIFPTHIASSSKVDTIAVCDHHARKVIVIDYNGKVQSFYKGWGRLRFGFLPETEVFIPISVCSTSDGNYVIADLSHNCLHVLSPYGKFIGILRCENGDIISNTSALCVDSEDNIWVGHGSQGTISVLKPSSFKNVFNQFQLPLLPEIPQLNGDSDE
jgi:sugar lactone lactonase YvrE